MGIRDIAEAVESTNDRVKLFSIMIMVGIVALGAWQVSSAFLGAFEDPVKRTKLIAAHTYAVIFQTQVPHRLAVRPWEHKIYMHAWNRMAGYQLSMVESGGKWRLNRF